MRFVTSPVVAPSFEARPTYIYAPSNQAYTIRSMPTVTPSMIKESRYVEVDFIQSACAILLRDRAH